MRVSRIRLGHAAGRIQKANTGKRDWDEAKPPAAAAARRRSRAARQRITIADTVKVVLDNREGAKIAPATLCKYKTVAKQPEGFASSRGYVMLDQFTPGDIAGF